MSLPSFRGRALAVSHETSAAWTPAVFRWRQAVLFLSSLGLVALSTFFVLSRAGKADDPPAQPRVALALVEKDGRAVVEVRGLSQPQLASLRDAGREWSTDRWQRLLALYVAQENAGQQLPVIGEYRVSDKGLYFIPRYPLKAGLPFDAAFAPSAIPGADSTEKLVKQRLLLPEAVHEPAYVSAVYPSRSVLPENQLKFYLHFSAPMRQGDSYQYVHLLDSNNVPVDRAFLTLEQELWDRSGTRFTLYFDPGRVKQGLRPREDLGPVLERGKTYTLVINKSWPDAHGNALRGEFRKTFRVAGADDVQPQPRRWSLNCPTAGSTEPLVADFGEPLDHSMLLHVLGVSAPDGEELEGEVTITHEETRWSFRPSAPWRPGKHLLVVANSLEDLAGNNVKHPFEVDVFDRVEATVKGETTTVPFRILSTQFPNTRFPGTPGPTHGR